MTYSLAVDIGGTFTDVVLRGDNGALTTDKTLTTHHDLLEGFFRGVDQVLAKAGIAAGDIDGVVVHATTVVTNALIERKGSPTRSSPPKASATYCRSGTSIAMRCTIRRSNSPRR